VGQSWETLRAHLLDILTQLGRGWQTHWLGSSAGHQGSSSQGDKAHSLQVQMPLVLTEMCQVGRGRRPVLLDTSGQGDMGGL
jgi:hypothetical protein